MKKRILIVGAAGFTGKALRDILAPSYALSLFDIKPIPDTPDAIQADLADFDAVRQAMEGMDGVVNAMMAPNETYNRPEIPFRSNVLGCANLLEAAREFGVKRFVHLSTTAIFGAAKVERLLADTEPIASGYYAVTKLLQEALCKNYAKAHGMTIPCLRIAGGIVCGRTRAHKDGTPLTKGAYNMGWICRYDIAQACRLALESPLGRGGLEGFEVFYIGSTPELFAHCDIQRTVDILGWKPEHDFQEYR